jgi:hypothetical protein
MDRERPPYCPDCLLRAIIRPPESVCLPPGGAAGNWAEMFTRPGAGSRRDAAGWVLPSEVTVYGP